jgi:hypothetical protein
VCLGPHSYDSALALECVATMSNKISEDWANHMMMPFSADSEAVWIDRNASLLFGESQLLAISSLLSRSWFEV